MKSIRLKALQEVSAITIQDESIRIRKYYYPSRICAIAKGQISGKELSPVSRSAAITANLSILSSLAIKCGLRLGL